jgi:superfamily II DNA/RNA helicase
MPDPLRLDERIPETGFADPDDALDAFLGWIADSGLTLYPHQEEAILEVFAGNHVVLDAPTGSGKSLVATARHFKTFAELGRAWYTAPIKALVSEKFFELCKVFGAEHVGMMTGDGAINRDAPILCCTAEILANLALREGPTARVTSVVMDEFHYYADRDRGMAWQIPLLTLPDTAFVLMSATLGDTTAIRTDLEARTHRKVVEVKGVHRPVPLEFAYSMHAIHEAIANLVKYGKAPVYVVHFTQNAAAEQAQALTSVELCTKDEKKAIAEAIRGFRFHSPFGPTVKKYVSHGVGLHHAGLLPRYRLLVERLAQQGLLKVICGTDTLGVGINVPIRTVLFTQLCKFDGEKTIILPVREFKQIAGRAGRAGFDTAGYVVVQAPAHIIENARVKAGDPKKAKKAVKAQPPAKGYKHWDETTFQQLVERPPEPLEARFTVDHGRLLSLMQHAEETGGDAKPGYEAMIALIDRSHASDKRKEELRREAASLLANLEHTGVVTRSGDSLKLDPTLQHDFTLHHSLSLFLLDAIATVDPASPTAHLDIVTWVEAILEHPRPVLQAQVHREKGKIIAELKAAGVPYEERMDQLDDVSWPKPNGERIYAFFNTYAEKHPWVAAEAIRPKSVVREMAETYMSFAEYVKDLGLQRSEGVLLRYLSEAYRVLQQNVPADDQSDALLDLIAWLRALLAHVDSSLLTEWEALVAGVDAIVDVPKKVDISADRRLFGARIRAELHALVRAFSKEDWDEAAAGIRGEDWSADVLSAAIAPFVAEYGAVGFDRRAREAWHTTITPTGPHQWTVRQRLFPPASVQVETYAVEGHEDDVADEGTWAIEGRIDLRDDTSPEGPLIALVAVGP